MDEAALVHAFLLDGVGGGRRLTLPEVERWEPDAGVLWVHLDRRAGGVSEWLEGPAALDPVTVDALGGEDPRPRVLAVRDCLLGVFRGVNCNPGAEPEDMVSIRCWVEARRVITLRHRRVMAVQDLVEALAAGRGPTDPGSVVGQVVHSLLLRTATVVGDLADAVDDLEGRVLDEAARQLRPQLAGFRRQAITLRRHLAPQRDVLTRLPLERLSWLSDLDRARLREEGEVVTRLVEDLDAARDRAAVTQEELASRLAEQTNRTMYLLSLVAAIFMPLGLLTGLLGINVGGIPGADTPWAFTAVTLGLAGLAVVLVVVFRRLRWL